MKKFTHPPFSHTIIRLKDGSTYSKHWRYARTMLLLEGEFKNWDVLSSVQKSNSVISAKQNSSSKSFRSNPQEVATQQLPFWLMRLFLFINPLL